MAVRVIGWEGETFELPAEIKAPWNARGPWSPTEAYVIGDFVSYQNALYVANASSAALAFVGGNIIAAKNVTFEAGITGWSEGEWDTTDGQAHSGTGCLKKVSTSTGRVQLSFSDGVEIAGDTQFTIGGWFKASAAMGIEWPVWPDPLDGMHGPVNPLVPDTWTYVTRTFTTVSGLQSTYFYPAYHVTTIGDIVWVDDVDLHLSTGGVFVTDQWDLIGTIPPGADGATGATGPAGATGATGPAGADGSGGGGGGTVQVVTGITPPAVPAVNIIWIDTSGVLA